IRVSGVVRLLAPLQLGLGLLDAFLGRDVVGRRSRGPVWGILGVFQVAEAPPVVTWLVIFIDRTGLRETDLLQALYGRQDEPGVEAGLGGQHLDRRARRIAERAQRHVDGELHG